MFYGLRQYRHSKTTIPILICVNSLQTYDLVASKGSQGQSESVGAFTTINGEYPTGKIYPF